MTKLHSRQIKISAVDLFCGVGGLSYGLAKSGIDVRAGIDVDPQCAYAYEKNTGAQFVQKDIRELTAQHVSSLLSKTGATMLAGCAPCQPFSTHMRGADTSEDTKWSLLDEFARLVKGVKPDLVTMENVIGLSRTSVFSNFVDELEALGYTTRWKICHCARYGLPQDRRRLVLLASRYGHIDFPRETHKPGEFRTVRDAIGKLPRIEAGETHPRDRLHKARSLTPLNRRRLMASVPGGTWRDWPEDLRSECHRKATGSSFQSVYARMSWDSPSPTITTQSYNFGTGRFGHPEQCRSISIREAAILQGFPKNYKFIAPNESADLAPLGRLIGNAVPPPLAEAIGKQFFIHLAAAR